MSTTQADFKAACERRGLTPSQDLFSFWQDTRSAALAASGGNAAPELTDQQIDTPEFMDLLNTFAHESSCEEYDETKYKEARKALVNHIKAASAPNAALVAALQRIARWHGEFPPTGKTWADGAPTSYATEYGSNGERDYMRQVALDALFVAGIKP